VKIEIKVPAMGESVSEATVSRIIQPSESIVQRDQEILEIETDKVNQVLYSPQAGKLELTVSVGQIIKIGQTIGFVDTAIQPPIVAPLLPVSKLLVPEPIIADYSARVTVSDTIATLRNNSPSRSIEPSQNALAPTNRRRISSLRRTIAQRLVEVKNTTAMLTTFNEVDMSQIIEIRTKEKEDFQVRYGVKLGFMSFFVKAVVSALKAFPDVHAYIEGDDIVQFPNYDVGVAVSTEKGLIVPVIRQCDTATFGNIEKQIELYASKARGGTISVDDLRGGSFTITNGGVFGSLFSTPILNPPQSAILGMHSILKRPIAVNDQIAICPMMYLALSYDHRIIDGREAVQFLIHIKQNLEDPSRLLLEL
jgi:2-oxoglutarate dehydrogenase E2 component (dihydrolipoamide succinyltransferase)